MPSLAKNPPFAVISSISIFLNSGAVHSFFVSPALSAWFSIATLVPVGLSA